MSVKITSPNQYLDEELVAAFIQYLESNSNESIVQKGKEIHIYELKLSVNKKIEKVDNPEYITWKEFKDELLNTDDSSQDEITVPTGKKKSKSNGSKSNINIPKPPPQYIEKIIQEKEIVKTEVNATFKSMDTLYLPNGVSASLLKILDNFMNKKSGLFQRLGIPNKLGICIYGKMGTGKSTTIKVIGSYLGKDIYYVNMNGIAKNSELKMMFDFVIRKQCEGGIIVFEDIDVMSNIVQPRKQSEDINNNNLTDVLNSDELNLSYLLNLLDGTLCAKNTIFIMTTNHIDHLDPALVRPGRCDIKIELKDCDRYQIRRIWESVMETQLDEVILNTVPEYKFTPADLIFHLIEYVYQVDVKPEVVFEALYKKLSL
ncbi:MAG: AAA family ATPase, partial [Nitrososphaeraceae archaeon]|nr:AAA family ATPase [Nitrososphaeraceae archaeon]